MAQLNPSRYRRLTNTFEYGVSDALYLDTTNNEIVLAVDDRIVGKFPYTQTANQAMVSDGTDIEPTVISGSVLSLASEARGDIIRRGASAWERHAAKTSGQVLIGDGTDIASVALSGDVTVNGSGVTAIGANKVTAGMLGANLGIGTIQLDITTAKIISGDAIGNTTEGLFPDGNTSPSLARVNGATDKALRLIWAASDSTEIQFAPFAYPQDFDDTAALNINLMMAMAGATDTPAVAVSFWENTGDTNAGGNTAAISGTTILQYQRVITAGNVGSFPKFATITLTPGAHTTDALYLYAAFITYTRRT